MATILYVEDNAEHRLMMHTLLTSRGFAVELGRNGEEGVKLAKEVHPDLILLDLYMPKMDGFGTMEHLEQDPTTKDIPIIVVSAWPTGDHRERVFDGGARAFVAKPYDTEALIDLINENLPIRA
jgi:two-component system cell cycle response regulator DivK